MAVSIYQMRPQFSHMDNKSQFIVKQLLSRWWISRKVEYPWRFAADEFSVVVAEILLQQTNAESVAKVYPAFISQFPDWNTLAGTDIEDIKDFIHSLGLATQKARRLKRLAQMICKKGGRLPSLRSDIEDLPGIGSYVANAIFSIARGESAPLLDVNMARVLNRLFNRGGRVDRDYWNRDLWLKEKSIEMFPNAEDGWMVIDFAKQICRPVPNCSGCPVSRHCMSHARIGFNGF